MPKAIKWRQKDYKWIKMEKNRYIVFLLLLPFLTSCASIISGTKANVTVSTSNGEPARASVDGENYYINGPTTVKVKRGFKKSTITAENETSHGSVEVEKGFNPVAIGNILLGGIPGIAVDAATGAMTKPTQSSYVIYMQPKLIKNEPTEKVDGLGTTVLEHTIVRWDIQSRPQGADIFWRVVSKTPDVKSTNNKYLMTTPYEATKALDIIGLTYQTSGNVRIILRCEKDGYLPQEKEFDARMVMDQEEISAFFRLVKE